MLIDAKRILSEVDKCKPVLHCITNVISINDCANVILALGAHATMAHHIMEVEEIASNCNALVCNMGATEWLEEMYLAMRTANSRNIPIVIDPVGVAASSFRREKCLEYIAKVPPLCVRGNRKEIEALYYNKTTARGVDSCDDKVCVDAEDTKGLEEVADIDDIKDLEDIETVAMKLALRYQTIIVVSGEVDIITDGERVACISGGSEMMTRITGAGCMLTAMIGVFVTTEATVDSIIAACVYMGEAAKAAELDMRKLDGGTITFKNMLIDRISNIYK